MPPIVLQGVALWLLLLALLLREDTKPRVATRRRREPAAGPPECPFCGAAFDGRRACWCGSDGHWF